MRVALVYTFDEGKFYVHLPHFSIQPYLVH